MQMELRGIIMEILFDVVNASVQDAQQVAQTASAVASVVEGECASETLDHAANLFLQILDGAQGGEVSTGTADTIASGISSVRIRRGLWLRAHSRHKTHTREP